MNTALGVHALIPTITTVSMDSDCNAQPSKKRKVEGGTSNLCPGERVNAGLAHYV